MIREHLSTEDKDEAYQNIYGSFPSKLSKFTARDNSPYIAFDYYLSFVSSNGLLQLISL